MSDYQSGYGKRPVWQWVLLYVVIAAVVYGLVYYFVFAGKGGYSAAPAGSAQTQTQVQTSGSAPAPQTSAY